MAFISLGKIDKNIIPIILGCIFSIFNRFLIKIKGTILFQHIIILNVYAAASKLFTIIPLIFLKIRVKNIHKKDKMNNNIINNNVNYIYHDSEKEYKRITKKNIYIIFCVLYYFLFKEFY